MTKHATVIAFLTIVAGYYFLRFRSLHRLLTNRACKPKITFKTALEAAIVIIAGTLFWKIAVGFPWSVALVFALIVGAGVGVIALSYYLFYWRER
jgi:hypothetical protein